MIRSVNETQTSTPYQNLTPDFVLSAVEAQGFVSNARIYPLNSYENRVYEVGIEDQSPLIVKFYRPGRWSNAQILEEHQFSLELSSMELPIVSPSVIDGKTLFEMQEHRFAFFERRAGHAPELDNLDHLFSLGQCMGRIHAQGATQTFKTRPTINMEDFAHRSRSYLLDNQFLPDSLRQAYEAISAQLIEKITPVFEETPYRSIRLHGDCHGGNILWRNDAPNFVDLDDSRSGPAVQDLWMFLSGDRPTRLTQLSSLLEGYEEFFEFDSRELKLIESLRTLRLMHYSAWLARRWDDPAFPRHFPWFNTEHYWSSHILELKEQFSDLDEKPLSLQLY